MKHPSVIHASLYTCLSLQWESGLKQGLLGLRNRHDSLSLQWESGLKQTINTRITTEAAGYFQGKYITEDELRGGFTIMDGEAVDVSSAEYRYRYLGTKFFTFAPHMSVYIWGREFGRAKDEIKSEVHEDLMKASKITVDL